MNKMRAMLKDALVEAQTTLPQYTTHAQELIKEIERQIEEYDGKPSIDKGEI